MKKNEIQINRDYYVVKNNSLIQKSRYSLTTQEQKIMLYIISKIKPNDEDFILYEFKITDFCDICGIEKYNGKNYYDLKQTIKNLSDKSIWVTIDEKGTETLLRWIEKPYINSHSGIVQIRLDADMKPYLIKLKEHFTQYNYIYTLAMQSKYSIRLFELLRSYANLHEWTASVDELKLKLDAENYNKFCDFNRRVINAALREINDYSDIKVTPTYIKDGRKVTHIKFDIEIKKDITDRVKTWSNIEDAIN